jgi:hypothetical protein
MPDKPGAETSGSGVACYRCGAGSVLQVSSNLIAHEFAMTCGRCGYRGIYRRDDVKSVRAGVVRGDPPAQPTPR